MGDSEIGSTALFIDFEVYINAFFSRAKSTETTAPIMEDMPILPEKSVDSAVKVSFNSRTEVKDVITKEKEVDGVKDRTEVKDIITKEKEVDNVKEVKDVTVKADKEVKEVKDHKKDSKAKKARSAKDAKHDRKETKDAAKESKRVSKEAAKQAKVAAKDSKSGGQDAVNDIRKLHDSNLSGENGIRSTHIKSDEPNSTSMEIDDNGLYQAQLSPHPAEVPLPGSPPICMANFDWIFFSYIIIFPGSTLQPLFFDGDDISVAKELLAQDVQQQQQDQQHQQHQQHLQPINSTLVSTTTTADHMLLNQLQTLVQVVVDGQRETSRLNAATLKTVETVNQTLLGFQTMMCKQIELMSDRLPVTPTKRTNCNSGASPIKRTYTQVEVYEV